MSEFLESKYRRYIRSCGPHVPCEINWDAVKSSPNMVGNFHHLIPKELFWPDIHQTVQELSFLERKTIHRDGSCTGVKCSDLFVDTSALTQAALFTCSLSGNATEEGPLRRSNLTLSDVSLPGRL